jgi:hypothetical protein
MPIYPGAAQIQQATWTVPPQQEEWSTWEWRYYETGDSVEAVTNFYKSQMPGKGWENESWMTMKDFALAYYTKNNERDGAMVWIGSDEGRKTNRNFMPPP